MKLFQLNLICVARRIVRKSLVERLLPAGLSPVSVLHVPGTGLTNALLYVVTEDLHLAIIFSVCMTFVKYIWVASK